MEEKTDTWNKTELQVYILLLCANADGQETQEEIDMIRAKVPEDTFKRMYREFKDDSEEDRLRKIDTNVQNHKYTNMQLIDFRTEVYEIFFSDCEFKMMEKRLDWTLDNILY